MSSAFTQEWKSSCFTSLTRPGTFLFPRLPHPSSPISDSVIYQIWIMAIYKKSYTGTDKTKSNSENQRFKFHFQVNFLDTNWSFSPLYHCCIIYCIVNSSSSLSNHHNVILSISSSLHHLHPFIISFSLSPSSAVLFSSSSSLKS